MNTKENSDINFYGKVYGTGNAMLIGNPQELQVNAAVTTNRNTNFVYITNATASAASNQFIKFVDKTPRRFVQDSITGENTCLHSKIIYIIVPAACNDFVG